jgi:DNA-binding CsgD family transcriptional regulator
MREFCLRLFSDCLSFASTRPKLAIKNSPGDPMEPLSAPDLASLLDCLKTLHEVCLLQDFPAHVVRSLTPLVGSEIRFLSSFTECCNTLEITPAELRNVQIEPGYFQENPLVQRYFQTGDGGAYQISDLLSEPTLHQRENLYQQHLRPLGMMEQLAMVISEPQPERAGLPRFPRRHISPNQADSLDEATTLGQLAVGFYRARRSFSERDRTLLNLIRPHVAQAYSNAQLYSKLQHQLTQTHQAMDALGCIMLSGSGRVQFISPRALQLLQHYFPDTAWIGEQLPDSLRSWVVEQIQLHRRAAEIKMSSILRVTQANQSLNIRFVNYAATAQFLLILEENRRDYFSIASCQSIGLTQRESEVLFWVAQGKTDAEISETLSIAKKTVNKHLENLYKKLSVKSRAAAVIKALKILGLD